MRPKYSVLVAVIGLLSVRGSLTAAADTIGTDIAGSDESKAERCPLAVRGVEMKVKHISGGVVIEFTAPDKTQRADLERIVRQVSAMIEYYSKMAALDPETVLAHDGVAIPAVDIDVVKTERGAQVTIHPDERKDAPTVVGEVRRFKRFWDSNACIQGTDTQAPPPGWTVSQKTT